MIVYLYGRINKKLVTVNIQEEEWYDRKTFCYILYSFKPCECTALSKSKLITLNSFEKYLPFNQAVYKEPVLQCGGGKPVTFFCI